MLIVEGAALPRHCRDEAEVGSVRDRTWPLDRPFGLLFLGLLARGCREMVMVRQPLAEDKGAVVTLPRYRPEEGDFARLLHARRSVRSFAPGELSLEEVAKALFAIQGMTRSDRFRTVPSAGALYPLEVSLVAGQIQGLEPGVYRYEPGSHALRLVLAGDHRAGLARASLNQSWIGRAQSVVVISAVYERITVKYGFRGETYVHMEAGAAAQNLSLQAAELGLGTTLVGAFHDEEVRRILGSPDNEVPLLVLPLGRAKRDSR